MMHFCYSSHPFFVIFTFKISWSWKCRSRSWNKYLTSYLMAIVPFEFCFNCQNTHLKSLVKIIEYNILNGSIRWQISISIKVVLEHFSLTLTVFEIFTFQNFDLENLGHGHDVQQLQWRHSMAITWLRI